MSIPAIPPIESRPLDTEPCFHDDLRALRNFLRSFQGEPVEVPEAWEDRAAREAGVPRFGEI